MAYLNAEQTKTIRQKIKEAFPANEGWKFSVTCRNHSSLHINILQAPLDFDLKGDRKSRSVHHNNDFERSFPKDQADALEKIAKIARSLGWYNKSDIMTDYFDTAYYIHIDIGHWEKGFKYVDKPKSAAKKEAKNKMEFPIQTEGLELIKYSEKSYAIFGNTKPYKVHLGKNGLECIFNGRLTHPQTGEKQCGWIVTNNKLDQVKEALTL